ncbi:hypothetical protein SASPL_108526 [Salvia splendens]|uniref:HAT C-terminal dimerisation domain-containing protein n=1 Tax=Salvia splendens TaxID=180675 RepID=A0A8X8YIZ3_SALSN|nr:hypothetical protein SASPL_108526 [Salvia splendens]
MSHIETCFKSIYRDIRGDIMVRDVTYSLNEMFDYYVAQREARKPPQQPRDGDDEDDNQGRSENDDVEHFDILKWWSENSRYPVLSEMARDILAIPISSVASKSAFSLGGRILYPYRSSLAPCVFEALVCASDWLKIIDLERKYNEDMFEELGNIGLEEYQSALATVGVQDADPLCRNKDD